MTGAVKKKLPIGLTFSRSALILILASVVLLPLLRMLTRLRPEHFTSVVNNPSFKGALLNSVVYTLAASAISVGLAYLLAICTVRVDIKLKRMWSILLSLPMLIPSISHATGLIVLFGSNGIITKLLGLDGSSYIYGAPGIIAGSVIYAFPVAYIMLSDVLRYEDMSVYEAAEILGIGRMRAFMRISLPYMKKPLITAFFSTFTMIVTDYGVPMRVGGQEKTLSSLMYDTAIGQSELEMGAVFGLILLVPAILAFAIDILSRENASSSFVTKSGSGSSLTRHRILSYTTCTLTVIIALLPVAAFVLLSFVESFPYKMNITGEHYEYIFSGKGLDYLINSLIIALITAAVGTLVGFLSAYLTARTRSPLTRVLHLVAIISMAIPGMVLGLSYLMTFAGSFIYGTYFIMVMVNTAHFLSSPYLMMYNSLGKMNRNLEAVGSTLGIGRGRMLLRVFLPQSFSTLLEMFSYLFVNSMMTISAVAFLATSDTRPISLMIKELERSPKVGRIAVVSLLILAVNLIIKITVERIKILISRRNTEKTS